MYEGWFKFGDIEIVNTPRTVGYAETAGQLSAFGVDAACDVTWFERLNCTTLNAALEEELPYEAGNMSQQAPWWSQGSPFTTGSSAAHFLGIYGQRIDMITGSTREAEITQGIDNGGVIGTARRAVRDVVFQVILTAVDEDGLEYGLAWLSRALDEATGSTLTPSCGAVDLTFYTECPRERRDGETLASYRDYMRSITRIMHDVKATSGPRVRDKLVSRTGNAYGYVVEFVLSAGVPWIFGVPNEKYTVPNVGEIVISDIVYNLQQYPSAELASGTVVVSTNYAQNPSVETNDTGWSKTQSSPITAAQVTGGRSTELSAVGAASYRAVFSPTANGTGGTFIIDCRVPGIPATAGSRFSVNIWAATAVQTGTPVAEKIVAAVHWQNDTPSTLRIDQLGEIPLAGGTASVSSLLPPAGTTQAVVRVTCYMTSFSAGDVIRLYADALAITNP